LKNILVTGAFGFIGKNLTVALQREPQINVLRFGKDHNDTDLSDFIEQSDFIYHLAGVNRPKDESEFFSGNRDLAAKLVEKLEKSKKKNPIVFSSSIQSRLENPYGKSKLEAENILIEYAKRNLTSLFIFSLPNVFGKWSRPSYNSAVATFCHHISRNQEIRIHDKNSKLELIYIDDVVREFVACLKNTPPEAHPYYYSVKPAFHTTVGQLADLIYSFRDMRKNLLLPDFRDNFTRYLYATYLSYLDTANFSYPMEQKFDERGWLFEFIKSPAAGQLFISKTRPGITRGNHYHDTKIEKFCVVQGSGTIKFRNILDEKIIPYEVSDSRITVVDIPPGYTHSIENTGSVDLITLFWASEIFNPSATDTFYQEVKI
jgi:UDP-2-acetamido-2,6-beta-L-arabino-hexul-4-ose reductase